MAQSCNQVCLFYLLEYNKWKIDRFEWSDYYRLTQASIASEFFNHRALLKKQYFKNLNCMMFEHVDAIPETVRRPILDEPSDDSLSESEESEEEIPQPPAAKSADDDELNQDLSGLQPANDDIIKVQEVPEEVLDSPIDEPQITSTETLPPAEQTQAEEQPERRVQDASPDLKSALRASS